MKPFMPTVTMPIRDWGMVITAVAAVQAYLAKNGKAKEADELELVGRQIARSCRLQRRARKTEEGEKPPCG